MKRIEAEAGRKEHAIRFGPRVLDLDILLYNDRIVDTSFLKIPHPRMHKRRFVLKPFCDIDPDKVHPVLNKDMAYLLNALDDQWQKVILHRCDCS
jgi:2-amino-4-hydroxy-6-hydroxymethyldihydropteridine diphosphokinase